MRIILYKILAFLFPGIFEYEIFENIPDNKKIKNIEYSKRKLLSQSEISFYRKLKKIETLGNFIVLPQINLASIITKAGKYRNELFRNIDFGIFDSNFDVLLLIELNDKTHKQYNRHKRDLKVQEICKNCNIKLITFYTSYPNEETYVINRILKELNPESQKQENQ